MKAAGTLISLVALAGSLVVGPHLPAEAKIPPFDLDVEVDDTAAAIEVTFDGEEFDPPRLPDLVAIFPESAMDTTGRPADQSSRVEVSLTRTAPGSFAGTVDLEPGRWVAVPFPEMKALPKFAEPLGAYPEPVAFQTSTSRSALPLVVGALGVVGVGAIATMVLGGRGWKPALAAMLAVTTTAAGVTALAVEGDEPFECPVTIPSPPGLSPPEPYPAEYPGDGMVWYGTEDLWTVLPVDGEYGPRKSVWWSVNFPGGAEEEQPDVRVTWTRLDNEQPVAIQNDRGTNAHTASEGWFMIAGIDPYSDDGEAAPGCWEVTARYKGASLTYVYEGPTVG